MKLNVDWHALGELFKAEGLAPKQNMVYTLLMNGGYLPESTYNTLAIYNHDYSVITDFDDWKMLAKVCLENIPNTTNHWKKSPILSFLSSFAEEKSFSKELMKEVLKSPHNYLGLFQIAHFNGLFTSYMNNLSVISEEEDIEMLRAGLKINFFNQNHLNKLSERIKEQVLFDFAKDPEIVWQLNYILPMITLDSKEQWSEIFAGSKQAYEVQFLNHAYDYPFYQEIIQETFQGIVDSIDSIGKKEAQTAYGYVANIIQKAYPKKSVPSIIFEVLKKIHTKITVWQHEVILNRLKNNKKVVNTPEFESYIKYLVAEETRAGVLKCLVSILPQKQLPWLLSSEFKTVKKAVKKKLKA
jgi:hypothetical protein